VRARVVVLVESLAALGPEVEQRLVEQDRERALRPERCRQGDKEACRLLGEDTARRDSKAN